MNASALMNRVSGPPSHRPVPGSCTGFVRQIVRRGLLAQLLEEESTDRRNGVAVELTVGDGSGGRQTCGAQRVIHATALVMCHERGEVERC